VGAPPTVPGGQCCTPQITVCRLRRSLRLRESLAAAAAASVQEVALSRELAGGEAAAASSDAGHLLEDLQTFRDVGKFGKLENLQIFARAQSIDMQRPKWAQFWAGCNSRDRKTVCLLRLSSETAF